ncbi:MAG: hypothetical protein V2A53_10695 [bacterium]
MNLHLLRNKLIAILLFPCLGFGQLPIYERHIKMPSVSGNCELEIGDRDITGKQDEALGFYTRIKSTLLGKVEGFDATGLIEIDHCELKQFYISAEREKVKGEVGDIYLDISELTAKGLGIRGLNLERKTKNQFSLFLGRTKEEEESFAGIKAEFYPKETRVGLSCLSFLDDKSKVSPISSNVLSIFGFIPLEKIGSVESELAISSYDPDKRKEGDTKKDSAITLKLSGSRGEREIELSYNQIGKDYKVAGNPYLLGDKEAFGIKATQPIKKAVFITSYSSGKESGVDTEKIEAELKDLVFLGITTKTGVEIEKKKKKSTCSKICLELGKEVRRLSLSPVYEWTRYDDEAIDSDYTMNNLTLGVVGDIGSVTLSSNIGCNFSSKGPGKERETNYNLFLAASYQFGEFLIEPEYSLYLDREEKKKIQQEETLSISTKYSISPKYQGLFGYETKESKDFSAPSNNYKMQTLKTGFQVLF